MQGFQTPAGGLVTLGGLWEFVERVLGWALVQEIQTPSFWPGESVLGSGGDRTGGVGDVGSGELAANPNWGPGDSVGDAVGSDVVGLGVGRAGGGLSNSAWGPGDSGSELGDGDEGWG